MLDKEKAVQGVGVYAEFVRDNATTQIIIVPDGYDTSGREVRSTLIRRTITGITPKKQWKFSKLATTETKEQLQEDQLDYYVADRMRYATTLFDQLVRGAWKLQNNPILIEVSKKDYDSIYWEKTPTKMIYRVNQSRIALGYPEELIQPAPKTVLP